MKSSCVYRIYDANDALLYIGYTSDLELRMNQHLRWAPSQFGIPGWREIREGYHRHDVTVYASVDLAERAEKAAILAEAPLYNRRGNPTRWKSRGKAGVFVPVTEVPA